MRKVLGSTPVLVVSDIHRAADFYVRVLGYQEPAFYGQPPRFAMMHRDEHDLMLELPRGDGRVQPHGAFDVWDLHLRVADLDAEKRAIEAAGWKCGDVETTEYDMREIIVFDPDGHRICLGQDLATRPEDSGKL